MRYVLALLVLIVCLIPAASLAGGSPTGRMICGNCGTGGGPPPGGCDPSFSRTYDDGHGTVWYCTNGHYWAVLYNY